MNIGGAFLRSKISDRVGIQEFALRMLIIDCADDFARIFDLRVIPGND